MPIFPIAASIGLALWVGGLSLFMCVITPTMFKAFEPQEAGRFLGALFPVMDRWISFWGFTTLFSLLVAFGGRHFDLPSLMLELPVVAMFLLTVYGTYVLHPQIRELKGRLEDPKFKNTAHLETLRFSFNRLHRRSLQVHLVVLVLGWFGLGLVPSFLK